MIKYIILACATLSCLGWSISPVRAQCTQYYDSSVPVPTGWGAAYDVYTAGNPLLESVNCDSPPNVQLNVGLANDVNQRIWHTMYLSTDGATWSPIQLTSPSGVLPDGYFSANASGTLNITLNQLDNNWNFIAFLVAYLHNGVWTYGCADAQCASPGWDLQAISMAPVAPHLIITFVPAAPSVQDTSSVGTTVADVNVTFSDGTPFTGTISLSDNSGGKCALAGTQIVIGAALPAGSSTVTCTVTATQ